MLFKNPVVHFSIASTLATILLISCGCKQSNNAVLERATEKSNSSEATTGDSTSEENSDLPVRLDDAPNAAEGLTASPSDLYFCNLDFGSDRSKSVLTAADVKAKIVYVDLDSDGDLNGADECFEMVDAGGYKSTSYMTALIPEVTNGENTHTDLSIKYGVTETDEGTTVKGVFAIKLWGWDESTTDADLVPLVLTTEGEKIPTLHFNGPLTMGNYRPVPELPRGKETKFYSLVGTKGEDGGTLTAIANEQIPTDAHPKAEFEFPNQNPEEPPIKVKTYLKVRC